MSESDERASRFAGREFLPPHYDVVEQCATEFRLRHNTFSPAVRHIIEEYEAQRRMLALLPPETLVELRRRAEETPRAPEPNHHSNKRYHYKDSTPRVRERFPRPPLACHKRRHCTMLPTALTTLAPPAYPCASLALARSAHAPPLLTGTKQSETGVGMTS